MTIIGIRTGNLTELVNLYVTSRTHHLNDTGEEPTGLGLGFFIAKTLLGARVPRYHLQIGNSQTWRVCGCIGAAVISSDNICGR